MIVTLTTWNGQGSGVTGGSKFATRHANTWSILLDGYMAPQWNANCDAGTEMLMGMLCEAGTPVGELANGPYTKGTVQNGTIQDSEKFDAKYQWVGWSKIEQGNNLRCSLSLFQGVPKNTPSSYPNADLSGILNIGALADKNTLNTRPSVNGSFKNPPDSFAFSAYLVHLPSGGHVNLNISLLTALMTWTASFHIPTIIAGDMNIDLLNQTNLEKVQNLASNYGWTLLRTGYSTQQSGGELDWALARNVTNPQTAMVGPIKDVSDGAGRGIAYVANGVSDHAVINYRVET